MSNSITPLVESILADGFVKRQFLGARLILNLFNSNIQSQPTVDDTKSTEDIETVEATETVEVTGDESDNKD